MNLNEVCVKTKKGEFNFDLKNYIFQIKQLEGYPSSQRYFESLYRKSMEILRIYGTKRGFIFRGMNLSWDAENVPIKKFKLELGYTQNLEGDVLAICISGNYDGFKGIVGLSRGKGHLTEKKAIENEERMIPEYIPRSEFFKYEPYKTRILNLNGGKLVRYDF